MFTRKLLFVKRQQMVKSWGSESSDEETDSNQNIAEVTIPTPTEAANTIGKFKNLFQANVKG